MKIQGFTTHGETENPQLLAGIFPAKGIHALVGTDAATNAALASDLAVALAAGAVACGLGMPDVDGARSSLSGFFGQRVGEPVGVAIIASSKTRMVKQVEAAALARGVNAALPIAIASPVGDLARAITNGELALYRPLNELPRRLALVIIEAGIPADPIRRAALVGALLAAESVTGVPVLLISTDSPAGLADADSTVLEATTDTLSLAQAPAGVAAWTRAFSTSRIILASGEALAIQPGATLPHRPRWKAVKPAAVATPAPAQEPEITSRHVIFVTGRHLEPAELAPWDGYKIERNEFDALPKANDDAPGVRLVVIVPTERDARNEEAGIRRFKLQQEARARGVESRVLIRISERRIAA
jgi:hypothetical protein